MKIGFSQMLEFSINGNIRTDCFGDLPEAIYHDTDTTYSCELTENGCFLKPSFRDMPYRNSFAPEIDISISQDNDRSFLCIKGKPVKIIRSFMMCWCGFLLMMEAVFLIMAAILKIDSLFLVSFPVILSIFGCLIWKVVFHTTCRSVVNVIKEELFEKSKLTD